MKEIERIIEESFKKQTGHNMQDFIGQKFISGVAKAIEQHLKEQIRTKRHRHKRKVGGMTLDIEIKEVLIKSKDALEDSLYHMSKKKIIDINSTRWNKVEECISDIEELLAEVTKNAEEMISELNEHHKQDVIKAWNTRPEPKGEGEIEEILMKHSFKIDEISNWSSFKKLNMGGAKRLAHALSLKTGKGVGEIIDILNEHQAECQEDISYSSIKDKQELALALLHINKEKT